ncbi:hypothetical protein [Rivibacter subsaxonicus]|uniref:Uncharacterized protein n=1 Tax=Rivibacter subsaxonicus TaxID=457575 RepID=A0A4Q7V9Z0_9BURK|nr:hypothetical protein [Rivibacter subsaxonicus]RZT92547.1 hypothetical protein EV670_3523 [Rivibacter subsaxonicus]
MRVRGLELARRWVLPWCLVGLGGAALAQSAVRQGPPPLVPPPLVVVEPGPDYLAWWRRARIQPSGTRVRGLPIERLQPEWCAADELSRERFPDGVFIDAGGRDQLKAGDYRFTLEGPQIAKGRRLIALVGVSMRCDGELGHFLVVLDPTPRGLKLRFLQERPFDGSALTVLQPVSEDVFRWLACLGCRDGLSIRWDAEQRLFRARPLRPAEPDED